MYSSTAQRPYCNDGCNNAACLHQNGQCSTVDALAKCKEEDKLRSELAQPPPRFADVDGLASMAFSLAIGQLSLITADGPVSSRVTIPTRIATTWDDPRWDNDGPNGIACRLVVSEGLQIPAIVPFKAGVLEQKELDAIYYLPQTRPGNLHGAYTLSARTVEYDLGSKQMKSVVTTHITFTQQDDEDRTPYFNFPFDKYNLHAKFVADAKLTNCSGSWRLSQPGSGAASLGADGFLNLTDLAAASAEQVKSLLPASGDWNLDESEVDGPQVTLGQEAGNPQSCVLTFRVRRNPLIYIMKAFLPDFCVMTIAMVSLFIEPNNLFSTRCSILIIAILITMNSTLNRNNGLGRLSYLLKIDYIAVLNLALLLMAMALTITIHICFRYDYARTAVTIDRAVRTSLPLLFYPGIQIFEIMLLANDQPDKPITFIAIWLSGSVAVVTLYYGYRHRVAGKRMVAVVEQLKTLDLTDPKAQETLQQAFELFDVDSSGALDAKEGKKLLKYVNPKLGRAAVAKAIRSADINGTGIVADEFHLMIQSWATGEEATVRSPLTLAHGATAGGARGAGAWGSTEA